MLLMLFGWGRWTVPPQALMDMLCAYGGKHIIARQKTFKSSPQNMKDLQTEDLGAIYYSLPHCQKKLWDTFQHILQMQNTMFGPNVSFVTNATRDTGG
jgi:hypothetical protein